MLIYIYMSICLNADSPFVEISMHRVLVFQLRGVKGPPFICELTQATEVGLRLMKIRNLVPHIQIHASIQRNSRFLIDFFEVLYCLFCIYEGVTRTKNSFIQYDSMPVTH